MTWTFGEYEYQEFEDFGDKEAQKELEQAFEESQKQFEEWTDENPIYLVYKSDGTRRLGIATINGLLEVLYGGGEHE